MVKKAKGASQVRSVIPHVAIFISTTIKTQREILKGILRFVHLHVPWIIHIEEGREYEYQMCRLQAWGCTGVITCLSSLTPPVKRFLQRKTVPVLWVDPSSGPPCPGQVVGKVVCDNKPIAIAAADYFLRAGLRNFAFVGEINGLSWSQERGSIFARRVEAMGYTCHVYPELGPAERADAAVGQVRLGTWLKSLPKPVALFAAYDVRARQVLDACMQHGIIVPDDIAILGVDDDETLCVTSYPPLSSIPMNTEETGFAMGRLLDKAMREKNPHPAEPVTLIYTGNRVVERESTKAYGIQDPFIRRCLDLIELNLGMDFHIADIADCLGVSKRYLEARMLAVSGKTVIDQIKAVRVRHAQTLLRETDMDGGAIAAACGFYDASHFVNVFKSLCGMTPRSYRLHKQD